MTEWSIDALDWMPTSDFYRQDPRRRGSDEVRFGDSWTAPKATAALSWFADTGEVVLTCRFARLGTFIGAALELLTAPSGSTGDAFGQLRAAVVAVIQTRDEVEQRLAGWQSAMGRHHSLDWIRERLAEPRAP